MAGQPGLFDLDERYAALSKTGNPLERLAAALARSDSSRGGRPPMDAILPCFLWSHSMACAAYSKAEGLSSSYRTAPEPFHAYHPAPNACSRRLRL